MTARGDRSSTATAEPGEARAGGRWRRALQRITADEHEIEAAALQRGVAGCGATPVTRCQAGTRVHVAGTLQTVTLRPRAGLPALEAELFDGSGTVRLVWLGRRRIAGIEPGRVLVAYGRLCLDETGRPLLYNADYDLKPTGASL